MKFPPEPDWSDEIVRCVLAGRPVRIVAVTTTGVAREAARRHDADAAAALALARGLTAALLLATLTKDEERVTLQVLGDGPLGGLTVDASSAGTARAYVRHPEVALALPAAAGRVSLGAAIGRFGVVSVIRDLGLGESFSGRTAIASGEIDEDVERYLADSEQIPSALACDATLAPDGRVDFAAGVLVQAMPGSEAAADVEAARARFAAGAFLRALAARPLDAEAVARAAVGGPPGKVQILDRRLVRYHCPCSRARAVASLALLGAVELSAMILEDGKAEVTCNFCRARYDFDDAELELVRRDTAKPSGPPS